MKVCTSAASRCQSAPERKNIPVGMLSRQKAIGSPTTSCSMPARLAQAAVARPYGPAPITKSGVWVRASPSPTVSGFDSCIASPGDGFISEAGLVSLAERLRSVHNMLPTLGVLREEDFTDGTQNIATGKG